MKKNVVKIVLSVVAGLIAFVIVFALFSDLSTQGEKVYSSNGFTITMDDGFYEKELLSATVYYEGEKAGLSVLREYFTDLEEIGIDENSSLDDYGEVIASINKVDDNFETLNDSIKYYTYEQSVSGKDFFYMAAITKGTDSFWLMNFFCETKNKDTYFPKFEKWLQTVKVD